MDKKTNEKFIEKVKEKANNILNQYDDKDKNRIVLAESIFFKLRKMRKKYKVNNTEIITYLLGEYIEGNTNVEVKKRRNWQEEKRHTTVYLPKEFEDKVNDVMLEKRHISFNNLINKLLEEEFFNKIK